MPTINVKIRRDFSKLDKLEHDLPDRTRSASYQMALGVKRHMVNNWSQESPSLPYNAPAKVTGELERSIKIEQKRGFGGLFASGWTIMVTAPYAAALEYGNPATNLLPRPYFRPAVLAVASQMGDYFKDIFEVR